jgi:predicted nucleic acid-binding protein
MAIVVDASAIVELLLRTQPGERVEAAMRAEPAYAPSLIDAEIVSAVARLERKGVIAPRDAAAIIERWAKATVIRVDTSGLIADVWRRRTSMSTYDAFYIALAERIDGTLVTGDRRLAGSPGIGVPLLVV